MLIVRVTVEDLHPSNIWWTVNKGVRSLAHEVREQSPIFSIKRGLPPLLAEFWSPSTHDLEINNISRLPAAYLCPVYSPQYKGFAHIHSKQLVLVLMDKRRLNVSSHLKYYAENDKDSKSKLSLNDHFSVDEKALVRIKHNLNGRNFTSRIRKS